MLGEATKYFFGAFVFSYCFFVFFADSVSPFSTPSRRNPKYRTFRVSRFLACALFLSLCLTLVLYLFAAQSFKFAAAAGAIVFAILAIYRTIRYLPVRLPGMSRSRRIRDDEPSHAEAQSNAATSNNQHPNATAETTFAAPAPVAPQQQVAQSTSQQAVQSTPETAAGADSVETNHGSSLSTASDTGVDLSDIDLTDNMGFEPASKSDAELQQKLGSDEHEMELAIARATAHIDDDLVDLDQSIVEAEFEAMHPSQRETTDVATPAFEASDSDVSESAESDEDTPELDTRIAALMDQNETLTNAHEELKGECARLQVDLRRKDAVVRKSEAEKKHALEVKDKAIKIAAMERKRRKLTEIRAQKIIMKLKRNAPQLEVEES